MTEAVGQPNNQCMCCAVLAASNDGKQAQWAAAASALYTAVFFLGC